MRRHRVFLLCTVGLCVISFLHYYKALHYVSLLRELSAPYPNIKSFIMVTGFFWRENGLASTPLIPASPEEAPPQPVVREPDSKARAMGGSAGDGGENGMHLGNRDVVMEDAGNAGSARLEMELMEELEPPHPWEKPKENQQGETPHEVRFYILGNIKSSYVGSIKSICLIFLFIYLFILKNLDSSDTFHLQIFCKMTCKIASTFILKV